MFKKFIKIFGIVFLSLSVVIGGTVGVLAITGVFNPEFVELKSISFSQNEYYIDDATQIEIKPSPENSTQLDLVLVSNNTQVVQVPSSVKAGEKFTITPSKTNGVNNGGIAELTAYYGNLIYCKAKVYVDVEVKSINITSSQVISTNTIINGTNISLNLMYFSTAPLPISIWLPWCPNTAPLTWEIYSIANL